MMMHHQPTAQNFAFSPKKPGLGVGSKEKSSQAGRSLPYARDGPRGPHRVHEGCHSRVFLVGL